MLRPGDLLDAPASFLGRTVEVTIVEPLSGPDTPEALARAEYGQIRVTVPDAGGKDFALVPGSFKAGDPGRYRVKFDRVIAGPIVARGVFESDDDLAQSVHRPTYVLRVSSTAPFALEAPVRASSIADLEARRAYWDRRQIVYEGVLSSGFEESLLDGAIWFSATRGATVSGIAPPREPGRTKERVRVTGLLFAKPGARYGHMGGGSFEILASHLEHLRGP